MATRPLGILLLPFLLLGISLPVEGTAVSIAGISYQGVRATGSALGLATSVAKDGKGLVWSGSSDSVRMEVDQRSCSINRTQVVMNFPVAEIKGLFYVSSMDVQKTFKPLISPQSYTPNLRLRHIVIDPGHGGKDNGAQNNAYRVKEKNLALDIARRLAENLREMGYRVTLTRNDDRFIELSDRPAVANELGADLFISIHLNASTDKTITGAETYAYPPQGAPSAYRAELTATDKIYKIANRNDTANLWAAYCIQRSLKDNLPTPDRGVKRARLKVLETPNCPAVLVESGFLSAPSECSRLASGLYRQQVADAIASGVRAYHRMILAAR